MSRSALIVCSFMSVAVIDLAVIVHYKHKPHNQCSQCLRAQRVVGGRRMSRCGSFLAEKKRVMDGLQLLTATHLKKPLPASRFMRVNKVWVRCLLSAVPSFCFWCVTLMKRKSISKSENEPRNVWTAPGMKAQLKKCKHGVSNVALTVWSLFFCFHHDSFSRNISQCFWIWMFFCLQYERSNNVNMEWLIKCNVVVCLRCSAA